MATKRPRKTTKKKTAKRPKKTGKRQPDPALDSQGQQLKVGQRVEYDGDLYRVEEVFVVRLPEGGRQEGVYFRSLETNGLSQIHLPLVTIQRDGPRKRKRTELSLRDRLR
jgi:hypothetical protein